MKKTCKSASIITYLINYYQAFMTKGKIKKEQINEILNRGVSNLYPNYKDLEKKLNSDKPLRVYCGFDPSAGSLHIGNAIALVKLRQFQEAGHKVIFLIGTFTGMIGDPTDKTATRKQLTREEVLHNASNFKSQASAYLNFDGDNAAEVRFNHEWQDSLSFKDLISLASNFTVQSMIQRDMFQKRLQEEKPIFLHEFFYPLAQAYDSLELDVDIEVGGNDQMFNMLCGRDLLRAVKNKDKGVVTMKLLTDSEGKKMGKSEGNIVMLDEDYNDMYAKVMSWPDNVLESAFELCTFLDWEESKNIISNINNPRDAKMRLAWEITKINHDKEKADLAQEHFIKTVQNKEIPVEMPNIEIKKGNYSLIDLLLFCNLSGSKSEARRLIVQGGIKLGYGQDLKVQQDINEKIDIKDDLIIQRGKRQFIKLIVK